MQSFRFGAQLYTVRDRCQTPEDFKKAMKQVADIGYKGVQVSGVGPMDPQFIRDCCDDNGLEIVCTHISFDEMLKDLDAVIQKHKTYGCAYPGIGSMPREYLEDGVPGIRRFIAKVNDVARRLEAEGMSFLYHNHAFEFQRVENWLVIQLLMEECIEAVQFELDTYWVQAGGANPVKYLYGRSADVIHFKDMIGSPKNTSLITTVGSGNLDWEEIIKACRATRVRWAMVEQDNAVEGDSIACLANAFDFLIGMGCQP